MRVMLTVFRLRPFLRGREAPKQLSPFLCMCFASAEVSVPTRCRAPFVISADVCNPCPPPHNPPAPAGGRADTALHHGSCPRPLMLTPVLCQRQNRILLGHVLLSMPNYLTLSLTNYERMLECLQSDRT